MISILLLLATLTFGQDCQSFGTNCAACLQTAGCGWCGDDSGSVGRCVTVDPEPTPSPTLHPTPSPTPAPTIAVFDENETLPTPMPTAMDMDNETDVDLGNETETETAEKRQLSMPTSAECMEGGFSVSFECPPNWEDLHCVQRSSGGCEYCGAATYENGDQVCSYCLAVSNSPRPFGFCYSVEDADRACGPSSGFVHTSVNDTCVAVPEDVELAGCPYAGRRGDYSFCTQCLSDPRCSFCDSPGFDYCIDAALTDLYCPSFFGELVDTCDGQATPMPTPAPPTPAPPTVEPTPAPPGSTPSPTANPTPMPTPLPPLPPPPPACYLRTTCAGCASTDGCTFCPAFDSCSLTVFTECDGAISSAEDVDRCPISGGEGGESGCEFATCSDCLAADGCTMCSSGDVFGERIGSCVAITSLTDDMCDAGERVADVDACFINAPTEAPASSTTTTVAASTTSVAATETPAVQGECQPHPAEDNCVFPPSFRVHADYFDRCSALNGQASVDDRPADEVQSVIECEQAAEEDGPDCVRALLSYLCDRTCPPCGDPVDAYRPCDGKCDTMRSECPTMVDQGCLDLDAYSCLDDSCALPSPSASDESPLVEASTATCDTMCIVLIVLGIVVLILVVVCAIMCISSKSDEEAQTPPATPLRASSRRASARPVAQRRAGSARQPSLRSSSPAGSARQPSLRSSPSTGGSRRRA